MKIIGYGLGKNPINVSLPEDISTVMVKNRAYASIKRSLNVAKRENLTLTGTLVPLKCGSGSAICYPVHKKDIVAVKKYDYSSGHLHVMSGESKTYIHKDILFINLFSYDVNFSFFNYKICR